MKNRHRTDTIQDFKISINVEWKERKRDLVSSGKQFFRVIRFKFNPRNFFVATLKTRTKDIFVFEIVIVLTFSYVISLSIFALSIFTFSFSLSLSSIYNNENFTRKSEQNNDNVEHIYRIDSKIDRIVANEFWQPPGNSRSRKHR